ncbi:peptidylprolyl isomerase [Qipengyuania huizhouensis]|uniref:peptidylprolyl isomerase n=1 Tax=Qipengyuania huizhouensis TaxID=2867245 RepID=UPI00185988F5|nr:peptidylprolyl isomerase [Qipengyuania huizhouensis]MBA4764540.1 peptidylprolyl isomerase [Erythrobacter sp.]MBX7459735.1 peptidylprolyl isomerase [Qipengyuania huizhouensis]
MKKHLISLAAALTLGSPLAAQETVESPPSPNEIVEQAGAEEWVAIPAEDLLVMTLAPDAEGNARRVVIQLMPEPFSQGWVENIRTLARAGWYDDITVNRVQDNYVVQWGDPNYDNPEAQGEAKPLPEGLRVMDESDYATLRKTPGGSELNRAVRAFAHRYAKAIASNPEATRFDPVHNRYEIVGRYQSDSYAQFTGFRWGWPFAGAPIGFWPVHCYGMVGVGRGMSPDTGSGAELYTVIGHAPRHLDRNIALVGRIVEGMEHLSSLPRGSGALGFYTAEEADKRTPILSVRVASDLPEAGTASSSEAVGRQTRPEFEYLSTEGETFARYAEARANRRDPFFIVPAGGADICNIPVPVRRVER